MSDDQFDQEPDGNTAPEQSGQSDQPDQSDQPIRTTQPSRLPAGGIVPPRPTTTTTHSPQPDGSTKVKTKQELEQTIPATPGFVGVPAAPIQTPGPRSYSGLPRDQLGTAKWMDEQAMKKETSEWKVEVRRSDPLFWPPKGPKKKQIRIGLIRTFDMDTYGAIKKRMADFCGGGRYRLFVIDNHEEVKAKIPMNIPTEDNPPRNPEDETEEETTEASPVVEEEASDEVKALREQKAIAREQAELELIESKAQAARDDREERAERRSKNSQIEALREEIKESAAQTAQMVERMQENTNRLIESLANKESGVDKLMPLLFQKQNETTSEERQDREKREAEERERQSRRESEQRAEQIRREDKEREERHRREDKEREERNRREDREREDRKADAANQMALLMKLGEKKEDTSTPMMLQALVESNKNTRTEALEGQKAQAALYDRIMNSIGTIATTGDAKYDKLLGALLANRVEGGSREVDNFIKAQAMAKADAREMMAMVRQAEGDGDEDAPPVDPQQGIFSNIANVLLALILSKAQGNPAIQQSIAAATGQTGQLTAADYQQVANGMAPLVGNQMGLPAGGMSVPQQPALAAPVPVPDPVPPQPAAPFEVPPAPGEAVITPPQAQPQQAQQPQPPLNPHPVPKPNPPQPVMTPDDMQRLRDNVDSVIDQACDDLADENREQEWTDRAFEILPKWYLDRIVGFADQGAGRFDLIVALIKESCSVERFVRLDSLVQNQVKYQLFMQGLVRIVNEHRESKPAAAPISIPGVPTPAPAPAPAPVSATVPVPPLPEPVDATTAAAVVPVEVPPPPPAVDATSPDKKA